MRRAREGDIYNQSEYFPLLLRLEYGYKTELMRPPRSSRPPVIKLIGIYMLRVMHGTHRSILFYLDSAQRHGFYTLIFNCSGSPLGLHRLGFGKLGNISSMISIG